MLCFQFQGGNKQENNPQLRGDGCVCVQQEIEVTLHFIFSCTKPDNFGHRFGSKIALIGCTASVLVSRFRQTEFISLADLLLFRLKFPHVKCEDAKMSTSQDHTIHDTWQRRSIYIKCLEQYVADSTCYIYDHCYSVSFYFLGSYAEEWVWNECCCFFLLFIPSMQHSAEKSAYVMSLIRLC